MGEWDFGTGDDYSGVASSVYPSNFQAPSYTPPSGGFDFGNLAKSVGSGAKDALSGFGDVAKTISPLVGLGATGVGIASSINAQGQMREQNKIANRTAHLQERTAGEAAAAAAPLREFGADALGKAQRGEIPPSVQAMIDQWKQGAKAQLHQYLAGSGQGDSQTLAQMDQYIEQQGLAMAAQYLSQEIQQGTGALTGAAGALTGAGGVAGSASGHAGGQVNDLSKLIAEANEQMAKMTGSGG